jgi:hypothetical protein
MAPPTCAESPGSAALLSPYAVHQTPSFPGRNLPPNLVRNPREFDGDSRSLARNFGDLGENTDLATDDMLVVLGDQRQVSGL